MQRFESLCQIDADFNCFLEAQRPIPKTVLQCLHEAFDYEHRCAAPEFHRVYRGEFRMRDGRHRLCFTPQSQRLLRKVFYCDGSTNNPGKKSSRHYQRYNPKNET